METAGGGRGAVRGLPQRALETVSALRGATCPAQLRGPDPQEPRQLLCLLRLDLAPLVPPLGSPLGLVLPPRSLLTLG